LYPFRKERKRMQLYPSVAQAYSVLTTKVNHNTPAPTLDELLGALRIIFNQVEQAVDAGSSGVTISCSASGRTIQDLTAALKVMGFTVFHTFIAGEDPHFRLQINW